LKHAVDTSAAKFKTRDHAVDNLKGVLIILVILGHGGLLTAFKSPSFNFVQEYIYLFHMPLFFGLSALFVKSFSWDYLLRRFLQMMVPFYFFAIIDPINIVFRIMHPGLGVAPLLFHLNFLDVIKTVFIGSGFYLQSALWFLPTLFLCDLFFSAVYKYRCNKIVILVSGAIFCVVLFLAKQIQVQHVHIPYGVDIAIYMVPLLFLLHYVYKNKFRLLKYNAVIYVAGIILSSFLIFYLIPEKTQNGISRRFDLAQFDVPANLWGYALICVLSLCIFILFLYIDRVTIFSRIGLYTLPIFLFHTYPWFNGLQYLPPALFLLISVVGDVLIGIGLSKLLIKLSPKFSWIGMVP